VRHAPRSAWLGARWALGAAGAEAALLTGFTGALLAACLLALQRAPAPDAAGASHSRRPAHTKHWATVAPQHRACRAPQAA